MTSNLKFKKTVKGARGDVDRQADRIDAILKSFTASLEELKAAGKSFAPASSAGELKRLADKLGNEFEDGHAFARHLSDLIHQEREKKGASVGAALASIPGIDMEALEKAMKNGGDINALVKQLQSQLGSVAKGA